MKLVCCGLIGAFLLVPASAGAQAQVFKCVDERGRTYYSDKPGPRCKSSAKLQAPAASKPAPRQQASTRPQGVVEPQDPARCASMRRELVRLATSRRVASISKKGEVTYQEDPTRERRLAQLQEEMRGCP